MATDVTMPRLSDSMEEGTVLKWLVEEGGDVKRGAPLVEIETDKANMTYEADTDGTLIEVVAQEGDTLAIGELIARIGEPGEASGGNGKPAAKEEPAEEGAEAEEAEEEAPREEEAPAEEEADAEQPEPASEEPAPAASEESQPAASEEPEPAAAEAKAATKERAPRERAPSGNGGRVKASPVARRMARELGVEIARLEGSGPGGRIVKADVQAAAEGGAAPATAPERADD